MQLSLPKRRMYAVEGYIRREPQLPYDVPIVLVQMIAFFYQKIFTWRRVRTRRIPRSDLIIYRLSKPMLKSKKYLCKTNTTEVVFVIGLREGYSVTFMTKEPKLTRLIEVELKKCGGDYKNIKTITLQIFCKQIHTFIEHTKGTDEFNCYKRLKFGRGFAELVDITRHPLVDLQFTISFTYK